MIYLLDQFNADGGERGKIVLVDGGPGWKVEQRMSNGPGWDKSLFGPPEGDGQIAFGPVETNGTVFH